MSSGRVVVGRERGTSRPSPYRVMGARQSKKAYNYGFWLAQTGIIYDFLMRHQSPRTSQPHPSNHSLSLRVPITRLCGRFLFKSPPGVAGMWIRGTASVAWGLSPCFCSFSLDCLGLFLSMGHYCSFAPNSSRDLPSLFSSFFCFIYIYISLKFCIILSNSFIIAIVCVLDMRMNSEC